MIELLTSPDAWLSLAALTLMEIILGIDNIVFITIVCGRLPADRQLAARRAGLAVALLSRVALLLAITWVIQLTEPLFTLYREWSGKDLILFSGGVFLLYKATKEIYVNVERPDLHEPAPDHFGREGAPVSVSGILLQVVILDIVFSLDSVITAVGMVDDVEIMIVAVLLAVGVMMLFAGPIGDFVQKHPSVKILALAFLVLIGVTLIAEGTGAHVSKGYIYSAMCFSLVVELLNLRQKAKDTGSALPTRSEPR